MTRILVAGIGNIFMGDDGFGCAVAQRLLGTPAPTGVDIVDFGIRGIDLGYALMDGYDVAILVDTVDRDAAPGTVLLIEPDIAHGREGSGGPLIAAHELDPAQVLRFVAALGDERPRLLLVACQPENLGGLHGHMGLSASATAAVDVAVVRIRALLDELNDDDAPVRPEPLRPASRSAQSAIPAPGGTT